MSALCVITARGGSKRIPRKNIRDFCGKPIIAYSIGAALESGLFDEVMVSTDDVEIAAVARAHGAEVPFMRSAHTSDDYATTTDVLLEVVREYEERGRKFDLLCCLYPTAPFVTADKLAEARSLLAGDVAAVVPVVRFSYPPQRGFLERGGRLERWLPKHELARSQDLEPVFHDAGQFYFRDVDELLRTGSLVDGAAALEISELEVQDIDSESDWELAEMKYERMVGRRG